MCEEALEAHSGAGGRTQEKARFVGCRLKGAAGMLQGQRWGRAVKGLSAGHDSCRGWHPVDQGPGCGYARAARAAGGQGAFRGPLAVGSMVVANRGSSPARSPARRPPLGSPRARSPGHREARPAADRQHGAGTRTAPAPAQSSTRDRNTARCTLAAAQHPQPRASRLDSPSNRATRHLAACSTPVP